MQLPVVLASSSIYRAQLINKLNLQIITCAPDLDESPRPNEGARDLVLRLAREKAQICQQSYPNALIIGSDQVCCIAGQITGKPLTFANAKQQLLNASGKCVTFYTAIVLLNSTTGKMQSTVEEFNVYFRALRPEQIEYYLHQEQPFNCAGSFKSEGLGISLFSKLEGEDPNSLIGLPLIRLIDFLNNEGIDILSNNK